MTRGAVFALGGLHLEEHLPGLSCIVPISLIDISSMERKMKLIHIRMQGRLEWDFQCSYRKKKAADGKLF